MRHNVIRLNPQYLYNHIVFIILFWEAVYISSAAYWLSRPAVASALYEMQLS